MNKINQSIPEFPDYFIRSCTYNGVWLVETIDKDSNRKTVYDFVNKDYTGPETNWEIVPTNSLDHRMEQSFFSLQKALNKALLE
jgi:hypothetical protein